jgi:hypothetical protein
MHATTTMALWASATARYTSGFRTFTPTNTD